MTERASPPSQDETPLPSDSASGLETLPPRPIPSSSGVQGLKGDFGRFQIQALLGQGGMGAVYLARDTQLDRLVALKTPRLENDPDGDLLQRFYREAKAAGTVRHPNICPVYSVEELNGRPFLAMAYIEGRPMSDYISPEKPRPERQALVVVRKIALALQEAHDLGIVHRDLKPANVMIDKRGEPIVMDFGLARPFEIEQDSRITTTGVTIGSPAYMAPEQVDTEFGKIGPPSDQYSLGVILYELITGNVPFRGSVAAIYGKIISRAAIPPRRLRPEIDPRVEALVMRMMQKRPSERFSSMRAVAEAVQEILANPASPPVAKPAATTRRLRSPQQIAALIAQASDLVEDHKYDKAVDLLETVLPEERTPELTGVLEEALELSDEVTYLTARLLDAWTQGSSQDEIPSVRRLLELVPDHSLGLKILEKLKRESAHWWAGFSLSTPLGFSSTTLSALSQWGILLVALFSFTFGTMVLYYDLAESSLKNLPFSSRKQPQTPQEQTTAQPLLKPVTATPPVQAGQSPSEIPKAVKFSGIKHVKRLATLPLEWISSTSLSNDGQSLLISGVPKGFDRQADSAFAINTWDGTSTKIPDGWAYSILRQKNNEALMLRIHPGESSGSYNLDLAAVDLATGKNLWEQKNAHASLIHDLGVSTDGRLLLTGGMDKTLKAWDLVDRKLLWTQPFAGFRIAFDRAATYSCLVCPGWGLKKFPNALQPTSQDVPLPFSAQPDSFLDSSRNLLVSGLTVLNWSDSKTRITLKDKVTNLYTISLLPDGQHLFSSEYSGEVSIWSLESGKKLLSHMFQADSTDPQVGKYGLKAILAQDGRTLYVFPPEFVGTDKRTQLRQANRGRDLSIEVFELQFESEPTSQPASSDPPRNAQAITGATLAWSLGGDEATFGKRGRIARFSPDGKYIAVSDGDRPPQVISVASGKAVRKISEEPNTSTAFVPDSSEVLLLKRTTRSPIQSINILTGATSVGVDAQVRPPYNFAIPTHDQSLLFLEGRWDYLCVYDWKSKTLSEEQISFPSFKFDPKYSHLAPNRDGSIVAFAHGPTADVVVWNRVAKRQLARFNADPQGKWLTSIRFSPDDRSLATTSHDQTVKFWNASTGTLQKEYSFDDWIQAGDYSPDGRYFAAAAQLNGTSIRELSSGRIVAAIPPHQVHMSSVCFSPDGKTLATLSSLHPDRPGPKREGFAELKLWRLTGTSSNPAPASGAKAPPELKAPFTPVEAQQAQQEWSDYLKRPVEFPNSVGLKMRLVPPGRFRMGSLEPVDDLVRFAKNTGVKDAAPENFVDEYPAHEVHVTPFAISTTEVTLAQFRSFVNETKYKTQAEKDGKADGFKPGKSKSEVDSKFTFRNVGVPQSDNSPVVNVSWEDAQEFCDWLSKKENLKYRLPYEAEWEYACRAGTTTRYFTGNDAESLVRIGNVGDLTAKAHFQWASSMNANDGFAVYAPVGSFSANAFGMHDMHGNVWEWCQDFFHGDYYKSPVGDATPQGPASGTGHPFRGGSFISFPRSNRSSMRMKQTPEHMDCNIGFRIALEIPVPKP